MSTMDERKYREMYDAQCEVIDAIAEALHVVGEPNDRVIEAARAMTLRAFRAEGERDSAQRLCDIVRDYGNREAQALRTEVDVLRRELMLVTVERDTLRRAEDAERAYREQRSAELLREIKDIAATATREKA